MSVDGFIATKDGSLDWLNNNPPTSDKSDYGWSMFLYRIDAVLLMVRKIFEVCRDFNPCPYTKLVSLMDNNFKMPIIEYSAEDSDYTFFLFLQK